MKKLLNTLYVTSEESYLSLDGENVIVYVGAETRGRLPLHTIDSIVSFGYSGASPALMGKCASMNKPIVFLTPSGAFLSRSIGKQYGNILLRKKQFRICEDNEKSLLIAKNIISAKLHNQAEVLRRVISDHRERIDIARVTAAVVTIKTSAKKAFYCKACAELRGIEGEGASRYYSVFDEMILQNKETFSFDGRNRRPPLDLVNAMLSFGYSLLTSMCVSALESVGLDPYSGFFHTDRAGRCSLALDLEEEFRSPLVDRFVLSFINRRMISEKSFIRKENGAVLFTEDAKKDFIREWQKKKKETLIHPYLQEKVEWGLLPYVQAMLLSRHLREDIDEYPPFLWR